MIHEWWCNNSIHEWWCHKMIHDNYIVIAWCNHVITPAWSLTCDEQREGAAKRTREAKSNVNWAPSLDPTQIGFYLQSLYVVSTESATLCSILNWDVVVMQPHSMHHIIIPCIISSFHASYHHSMHHIIIFTLRVSVTLSTEMPWQITTSPESTKSRNSESSESRGTNSNLDFGLIWSCTEESEFLDLVDFGGAAFVVESVIYSESNREAEFGA